MIPFIEFDVPHWEDHSPRMDSTPTPPPINPFCTATAKPPPTDGVRMGGGGGGGVGGGGEESGMWHAWQKPQKPMSALILMGTADP